jgi:hypothetical protein
MSITMTGPEREAFLADITIERADVERDLRPLARRYLGVPGGDAYVEQTRAEHTDNVLVRIRPERWLTADFGKQAPARASG